MAATKMSRNRQRKTAYAALAEKGSRNQETIGTTPIIGRFETVEVEKIPIVDEETFEVRGYRTRKVKPYQRIVHDADAKQAAKVSTPKRDANAQKRRRQIAAWSRCRILLATNAHTDGNNCRTCGCPVDEQAAQQAA